MNRWMMGALVLLGGCSAPPTDENPGIDTGLQTELGIKLIFLPAIKVCVSSCFLGQRK